MRTKVRQWKRENVAKGRTDTKWSAEIRDIQSWLTLDRLGGPPVQRQDGILNVLIHERPPNPRLRQLRLAQSLIDDDGIGEKGAGV